jgi:DNA polymerase-3 subunit epsilon
MINTSASWADGPLLALDLETTGLDTANDRIVTAAVISIQPGTSPATHTWLADPGMEIPEEAAKIHGISTEYARQHGQDAATVVNEVADLLSSLWCDSTPLCAFKAGFDLSLLYAELQRHHQRPLDIAGPVVDPFCIDRAVDRYRKGRRTLSAVCQHHGVRLEDAHTSDADALATARLAWRLAKSYPGEVGTIPLSALHEQQIGWHRTQTLSFADYLDRLASQSEDPAEAEQLRKRAVAVREESDSWPLHRHTPSPAVGV